MPSVKTLGLSALLVALVLTGCSLNPTSAPYAGEDDGLVLFSADIVVRGDAELEYNYMISSENLATGEIYRQRMVVFEDRTFAVLGRLPAGEYRFVRRDDIRRNARGFVPEDIEGEFSVAAGEITIPKHIRVEKDLFTRSVAITDLSNAAGRVLFDLQLADRKEYQGWRFHDAD